MSAPREDEIVVTVLGSGSSQGVPRPALGWGDCDPRNPKNRRLRCSILIERHGPQGLTRILIDTSPDLREQLLAAQVDRLDAVFFTHEHADQTHGIDDLRPVMLNMRGPIDAYLNAATAAQIVPRFAYCFATPPGSEYPPILSLKSIEAGARVNVNGPGGAIQVEAFDLIHGNIHALGYRLGGLAYTPDVSDIPDSSLSALTGLECWIIDGLRYRPHPSHFDIATALRWVERMKPQRAVLTNLSAEVDYARLAATLPSHIVPGCDGMRVSVRA